MFLLYNRGPQPPGHGPFPVHGLLGTGPQSRTGGAGKLHPCLQPLPSTGSASCRMGSALGPHSSGNPVVNCSRGISPNPQSPTPPRLWKHPSLVPERLGTAVVENIHFTRSENLHIQNIKFMFYFPLEFSTVSSH